jgi:hypothetical protein
MVWRDQDPPATDVLLDFTVPFSGGGTPAYLEIDKLPEGLYRATVGTLFEYQELCRTGDLEGLLRHSRALYSRAGRLLIWYARSGRCGRWTIPSISLSSHLTARLTPDR